MSSGIQEPVGEKEVGYYDTTSHDEMGPSRQGSKADVHISVDKSEVLGNSDLLNDAYAGEDFEHGQGMWAAVKAHPMACIWAFVFCFTIVSLRPGDVGRRSQHLCCNTAKRF